MGERGNHKMHANSHLRIDPPGHIQPTLALPLYGVCAAEFTARIRLACVCSSV